MISVDFINWLIFLTHRTLGWLPDVRVLQRCRAYAEKATRRHKSPWRGIVRWSNFNADGNAYSSSSTTRFVACCLFQTMRLLLAGLLACWLSKAPTGYKQLTLFKLYTGEERDYLDKMKLKAATISSATNNHDYFVLLTDAISIWRGNTPKVGTKAEQKAVFGKGDQWETRIIGVEAICGNVDTIVFYTIDDMQCGGANVMVSVWLELAVPLFLILMTQTFSKDWILLIIVLLSHRDWGSTSSYARPVDPTRQIPSPSATEGPLSIWQL